MLEVGDGVNITVGGAQGLDNINPYDPWRFFLFNVGSPKETGPTWKKYRVCTALDAKDCSSLPPDRDMKESDRKEGLIGYAGIKIGAVPCPCVIVLQDSNKALYKVRVKKLPQPPPTHPINKEGEPPTANDNSWTAKSGDDFVNVGCFDTETSFEWCQNLIAARVFDQAGTAIGVPCQYERAGRVQAGYPVRQWTSRRHPLGEPAERDGEVAEGHHPTAGPPRQVPADAVGSS